MRKSGSTEELFKMLGNQKQRIKTMKDEAIENNKSLESYLWKQAKQPLARGMFPLKDLETKQNISRIYKLMDGWKMTQKIENTEVLNSINKDIDLIDGIIEKLSREISNRKIYGNRPPSMIRNRLKELNQQVKNKKISN